MVTTEWKKQISKKALFGGLVFIAGARWLSEDMFVLQSNLIQVNGELRNAHIYISPVTNTYNRYVITHTSKSQKTELIFGIFGQNHNYILSENIGDNTRDEKFEKLKFELEKSNKISV